MEKITKEQLSQEIYSYFLTATGDPEELKEIVDKMYKKALQDSFPKYKPKSVESLSERKKDYEASYKPLKHVELRDESTYEEI